tara:strand:- start:214 stop:750 length:537 start_codon:yes stop_codon:yes gene_type:complete
MSKSIELLHGNLLDFPPYHPDDLDRYTGINNIAHSCNTRNIMGGGIAKQIKSRYPQAWEADCKATEEQSNMLGSFSKATIKTMTFLPDGEGTIYNLYTQADIGSHEKQVDYEYFWRALKNMQEDLVSTQSETGQPQVLGLPHGISCGLAGGSWNIILEMINDVFLDSSVKTYIVKFVI